VKNTSGYALTNTQYCSLLRTKVIKSNPENNYERGRLFNYALVQIAFNNNKTKKNKWITLQRQIKIGSLRIFDDSNRFFKAIWQFLQRQNQNYILKHIINWKKQNFLQYFQLLHWAEKARARETIPELRSLVGGAGSTERCERERESARERGECLVWIWGKRMRGFREPFSF
jgi:hypothetical protein